MKEENNKLKIAFGFNICLRLKARFEAKFMEENLQSPQNGTIPSQITPTPPKRNWVKFGIVSTVVIILTGLVFYTGIWYARRNTTQPPKNITPAENITPVIENWENRFLYDAFNYFYPPSGEPVKPDIRSINFNGTDERKHQILCIGKEVTFFWNVARSADGKIIAFLLPSKEQEANNPNWKKDFKEGKRPFTQGIIHFFDLGKNSCQSLGIIADDLYNQSMAFSPDGKYLAYVFYGLHLYNLSTKEDQGLTKDEGSAHFGTLITGPLLWNSNGSAIYTAISDGFNYPKEMPTSLYKINVDEIEEVKFPWSEQVDVTSAKLAKREVVIKLADLYMDAEGKNTWQDDNTVPDNPMIYAISPDETKIILEENGNLVIKNLGDMSQQSTITYNKKDYAPYEPYGHARKVAWLPGGWIIMSLDQMAGGSSPGFMFASLNGEKPAMLPGYSFSANIVGDKIIYNFSYFGIYYVPPEGPVPSGFRRGIDDTGHRYDGIGVYDLSKKEDIKISGKDKPSGFILE